MRIGRHFQASKAHFPEAASAPRHWHSTAVQLALQQFLQRTDPPAWLLIQAGPLCTLLHHSPASSPQVWSASSTRGGVQMRVYSVNSSSPSRTSLRRTSRMNLLVPSRHGPHVFVFLHTRVHHPPPPGHHVLHGLLECFSPLLPPFFICGLPSSRCCSPLALLLLLASACPSFHGLWSLMSGPLVFSSLHAPQVWLLLSPPGFRAWLQ